MGNWILFTSDNTHPIMICEWFSQIEDYLRKHHKTIEYTMHSHMVLVRTESKRYWIEYRKGTIR